MHFDFTCRCFYFVPKSLSMFLSFAASIFVFVLQCCLLEPANLYIVVTYVAKIENLDASYLIKQVKPVPLLHEKYKLWHHDPKAENRKGKHIKKYLPNATTSTKELFFFLQMIRLVKTQKRKERKKEKRLIKKLKFSASLCKVIWKCQTLLQNKT